MAGEMSQSEVTRETYPGLFALHRSLSRRGIKSEPRPFDQYQGPYLRVNGVCRVWYAYNADGFCIEKGFPPCNDFEVIGAYHIRKATDTELQHGIYTLRQASKRIASLAAA